MCEVFQSAWTTLNPFASDTVKVLLGLFSGWLLFLWTEKIRESRSQQELRRALLAELGIVEVLANNTVMKYARYYKSEKDKATCAREIRWFYEVGRQRMEAAGLLTGLPGPSVDFLALSDDQLVAIYSQFNETVGTKLITPILDRALAGQTFGFSAKQIQALSMVKWQVHLLTQDAESMEEMLRLSFTDTGEKNHEIVLKNHDQRCEAYARRAQTLLRTVRAALALIQKERHRNLSKTAESVQNSKPPSTDQSE